MLCVLLHLCLVFRAGEPSWCLKPCCEELSLQRGCHREWAFKQRQQCLCRITFGRLLLLSVRPWASHLAFCVQVYSLKHLGPSLASFYTCIQCWHDWILLQFYFRRDCYKAKHYHSILWIRGFNNFGSPDTGNIVEPLGITQCTGATGILLVG